MFGVFPLVFPWSTCATIVFGIVGVTIVFGIVGATIVFGIVGATIVFGIVGGCNHCFWHRQCVSIVFFHGRHVRPLFLVLSAGFH